MNLDDLGFIKETTVRPRYAIQSGAVYDRIGRCNLYNTINDIPGLGHLHERNDGVKVYNYEPYIKSLNEDYILYIRLIQNYIFNI